MRSIKLLLLLIIFILMGCVQVPMNNANRASNLAVTSVWDMQVSFKSGSQYSMSPKHLEKISSKADKIKSAYQSYAKAIKNNLTDHGYQEVQGADSAVFHVSFVLALSEDLDDQTLSEEFGVTPGLQEKQGLNKGSLLIAITDATTGQRVWHGAIQGFVQEEAAESELEQRRANVINMALAHFYKSH